MDNHQLELVIQILHKLISWKYSLQTIVHFITEWFLISNILYFRNQLLFISDIKFYNIDKLFIYDFQAKEFHETLKVDVCIEIIFTCKIKFILRFLPFLPELILKLNNFFVFQKQQF